MSVLTQAELDGVKLTDDEICAFLRLLLSAGAETTYRSSSNLLYGLLTHPEQLGALREGTVRSCPRPSRKACGGSHRCSRSPGRRCGTSRCMG